MHEIRCAHHQHAVARHLGIADFGSYHNAGIQLVRGHCQASELRSCNSSIQDLGPGERVCGDLGARDGFNAISPALKESFEYGIEPTSLPAEMVAAAMLLSRTASAASLS